MNREERKQAFIDACEELAITYAYRDRDPKQCPLCPVAITHRNEFRQKHERLDIEICAFCIHATDMNSDPCLQQKTYRIMLLNERWDIREKFYERLIGILKKLPAERFYGGTRKTRFPELYELDKHLAEEYYDNKNNNKQPVSEESR